GKRPWGNDHADPAAVGGNRADSARRLGAWPALRRGIVERTRELLLTDAVETRAPRSEMRRIGNAGYLRPATAGGAAPGPPRYLGKEEGEAANPDGRGIS